MKITSNLKKILIILIVGIMVTCTIFFISKKYQKNDLAKVENIGEDVEVTENQAIAATIAKSETQISATNQTIVGALPTITATSGWDTNTYYSSLTITIKVEDSSIQPPLAAKDLSYTWTTSTSTPSEYDCIASYSSLSTGVAYYKITLSGVSQGANYLHIKYTDLNGITWTGDFENRVLVDTRDPTAGTMTMKLESSTGTTYTSGAWTNKRVFISMKEGSDSGSGNASSVYNVTKDGAAYLTNQTSATSVYPGQGNVSTYEIEVITKDAAGNEATRTYTIKIDASVPTYAVSPTSSTSYTETKQVGVTLKDEGSGLTGTPTVQFSWHTSQTSGGSNTYETTEKDNSGNTIYYYTSDAAREGIFYLGITISTKDKAGNTLEKSTYTGPYYIDNIDPSAPTYTAVYKDSQSTTYTSGTWTNKLVQTKITSKDGASGISKIQYSTDKSNWSTLGFEASGGMTNSGTTYTGTEDWNLNERNDTYYFRAVDKTGNVSSASSAFTIKYDLTAPTITSVTGNPTTWTSGNVTLTINGASDSGAGLATSPYSFDGGTTWQTSNTKTYTKNTSGIKIQVKDALGNVYSHSELSITKIDTTAPTITSVTGNPTTWTSGNVTLTINGASDSGSGLAASAYSFDGGTTWQTSNTKTYTQNTSGIKIRVKDTLGNVYSHGELSITKIDTTAPTITSVTGNPTEWTTENVTLTITGASDSGAGLAASAYSFDGGATWQTSNTKTYTQNTSGIKIQVKDAAGNVYSHAEINITKIDKTAPTITSVTGNPTEWTTENVTLTITGVSDSGVGLASEPYSFDGGTTWQEANTKTYTKNTSGIVIQVRDSLGNIYTHQEIDITKIRGPVSIEVTTMPSITEYEAYENFNSNGMVVTLTYDNGNTEITTDYTVINGENLTCQVSEIEIQYNQNSEIKTTISIIVGHDMSQATCVEVAKCKVEGCTYQEGDALGHSFINYVSNNDATCTEDGTKTAKCDRCDETDTQTEEGTALGHEFTNYVSNNDATCTEDGTKTAKCDRCDETDTQIDEGSKRGHDYEELVTEPTCTEKGYTTHQCTRCEENYIDTYTDELGHEFTNYISNNDATCTEDGTETAQCNRCDEKDTRIDNESATGHNYENGECIKCTEQEPKLEIASQLYTINNLYIKKVYSETTAEQFKNNIQTNAEEIKIYTKDEEIVEDDAIIATGMEIEFKFRSETKRLTIVVTGDTDGDGTIKFKDILLGNQDRLNKQKLQGAYLLAADFNESGKVSFFELIKINILTIRKK